MIVYPLGHFYDDFSGQIYYEEAHHTNRHRWLHCPLRVRSGRASPLLMGSAFALAISPFLIVGSGGFIRASSAKQHGKILRPDGQPHLHLHHSHHCPHQSLHTALAGDRYSDGRGLDGSIGTLPLPAHPEGEAGQSIRGDQEDQITFLLCMADTGTMGDHHDEPPPGHQHSQKYSGRRSSRDDGVDRHLDLGMRDDD